MVPRTAHTVARLAEMGVRIPGEGIVAKAMLCQREMGVTTHAVAEMAVRITGEGISAKAMTRRREMGIIAHAILALVRIAPARVERRKTEKRRIRPTLPSMSSTAGVETTGICQGRAARIMSFEVVRTRPTFADRRISWRTTSARRAPRRARPDGFLDRSRKGNSSGTVVKFRRFCFSN
jgi:hypothetical protein